MNLYMTSLFERNSKKITSAPKIRSSSCLMLSSYRVPSSEALSTSDNIPPKDLMKRFNKMACEMGLSSKEFMLCSVLRRFVSKQCLY